MPRDFKPSKENFLLRRALPEDFGWLFDLHQLVFRPHIDLIWGWDEDWQRWNVRSDFESSQTWIVEHAAEAVGYLQTDLDGPLIYLRNIALVPSAQGRGIGAQLVLQLQREARDRGVPIKLSVFRTNRRARRFYERLGFRRSGRSDDFVRMSWLAEK